MKKSKDKEVQSFLDKVLADDIEKYEVLQELRKAVFKVSRKTTERFIYGGIMFSLEDDFGGLFVRQKHISFEFVAGAAMDDPQKKLEGKGKYRRHLKIRSFSEIKDKGALFFIKQAFESDCASIYK